MNRRHWIKFILTLIVLYWIESLIPESAFNNQIKRNLFLLNSISLSFYKPTKEEQRGRFWYHFFQVILIWICNVFIYSLFFTDISNLLLTLDLSFLPRILGAVLSQRFTIFTAHVVIYIYFINKEITNHELTSPEDPSNGSLTKDVIEQDLE